MRRTSRLAIPLALLLAAPAGALVPATPAGAQVPPPVRLLPTPPGPLVAAGVPVPPNPATRPVAAAALQPWAEDQLGFGRLVFPEPRHGHYTVTQDGERLVVGHDPGQPLADVTPKPRNVSAILNGPSTTAITAQPGAKFRTRRSGGNLVIEVLDPPPAAPPAHLLPRLARSGPGHKPMERPTVTAAAPPPPSVAPPSVAPIDPVQAKPLAPPAPPPPRAGEAAPPAGEAANAAAAQPTPPAPAPAVPPAPTAPTGIAIESVPGAPTPTIRLRADRTVGLAAFRAGPDILVVLDAAIEFRLAAPLDPPFAALIASRTEDTSVLQIPLAEPATLRFTRDAGGWLISLAEDRKGVGSKTLASIIPRLLLDSAPGNARVRLPATQPSRVVAVLDPQSGGRLLVGTQGAPGEAVLTERRQSAYIVEPSLQGVVVAATADDVRLKRETAGFLLITGPPGDGTKPGGDATEAATPWDMPVSQLLDIRNEPVESAAKELRQQILFAATAPAMTRSAPRVRVAETMVALAMGVEAQAVFNIAATDDPTLRDDPKVIGLRAVAAILAHRPDGAANLADPRLDGTNEIDLWRALQRVDQGQATDADGTALAKGLPVVLGYPPMLRERLLPATLEGMALNGQAPAAQAALTARPDDPSLELARGMVAEMTNRPDEALAAYDTVAGRADRLARTTALVRAVELRMKTGALDVSAGADALDRSLFSWRDGQQELPLRLRIAALRRNAGQFGQALTVLREGREAIPDARAKFDKEISATFDAMFAGDAVRRMAPADFVKLYDRNQDLMQAITWTEPVGLKLVDRLTELNLQGRAEPVLVRLVQQTTDPAHRTALGARLASLRLTMNDPAGAIAALSATVPPQGAATDPALIETRQLLYARAESERGNKDTALTMLSALSSAEADEARADILTARKDWPHAIAALTSLESKRIPPATSDLTADQQALIMRLAEAATLGSDSATLDRLATTYGDAMGKGSNAALFRLVTSAPIHGTKDLPRAFQEIQLTRQLPGKMAGGT